MISKSDGVSSSGVNKHSTSNKPHQNNTETIFPKVIEQFEHEGLKHSAELPELPARKAKKISQKKLTK